MKKHSFIAFLVLSFVFSVNAQKKTFIWESELCQFSGTYDASEYTEKQFEDTQKLLSMLGSIPLMTDTTVSKYEDIKNLSVEKLDAEYQAKSKELKELRLVPTAYWNTLREQRIDELENFYRLARINIRAYQDPSVINEYGSDDCCVGFYAEPLIEGGDYLLATWLKVNLDSRRRNASPERLKRIFDSQNASVDRLKYARVEVMAFGWWNCAVGQLEPADNTGTPFDNFKALFTDVKEECDEP